MYTFPLKKILLVLLFVLIQIVFIPLPFVYAATSPVLGQAASFVILSSTYTNTVGGTTLNGDLGYTIAPASTPTVNGTTYSPPSTKYSTAGTDQNSALAALNSQPCTYTFAAGAVDLATDTGHGTLGVYTPGVYCTTAASAASIGSGGITLNGSGTYIFRMDGALTTVANSVVTASGGASACNVFWTPTAATTLGANSTFLGTDVDASGITIGSTVNWTGQALAFGGTVTTTTDTMTVPTCSSGTTNTDSNTSSSGSSSNSNSNSNTSGSPDCVAPKITSTPLVMSFARVSPTSVSINWGPYQGENSFNIRYGLSNGDWLYSTNVTGFNTVINDLPANQPIWIQIATRNNCAIGTYGVPTLVGGPRLPSAGSEVDTSFGGILQTGIQNIYAFFRQLLP